MQKFKLHGNQKGFTLVEIAIVLVIIGLLIGGVLKGQEMIQNAKVKRVQKQADEIRAAIFSYQDRYQNLPGDDTAPTAHTGVAGLTAGGGNGQISAAEGNNLFAHLAAANLISGTYPAATPFPQNAFGGTTSVLWATHLGLTTNWVTYTQIPAEVARIIDTSLDDGVGTTGKIGTGAVYVNGAIVTLWVQL